MSERLQTWLSQELKQRGWSHSELARRTGLSQAIVSRIISGERNPSADFCIKAAQVLDKSPEKVLRLAGILPPLPASEDSTLQELVELARNLPPEQRKEALRYIRYLYQSEEDE